MSFWTPTINLIGSGYSKEGVDGICDLDEAIEMMLEEQIFFYYDKEKYLAANYLFQKYCEADDEEEEEIINYILKHLSWL